jgi:hypothetical protein
MKTAIVRWFPAELKNGCDLLVRVTAGMANATRGKLKAGTEVKMKYLKPLFERESSNGERIITVIHSMGPKTYTFEVTEGFVKPCP